MAFKPNYRQQRSERQRAKDTKKQEKLAKREEEAAKRRNERGPDDPDLGPEGEPHGGELHRREPHLDDPKNGPSVGAGGNDPADDTASGAAKAPVETVTGGRDPQA